MMIDCAVMTINMSERIYCTYIQFEIHVQTLDIQKWKTFTVKICHLDEHHFSGDQQSGKKSVVQPDQPQGGTFSTFIGVGLV